jgi:Acetyltransferase (GNAT) domain
MKIEILKIESTEFKKAVQNFNHDIYHLPLYILTEARRIEAQAEAIMISEGSKQFLLPYLIRRCPEDMLLDLNQRDFSESIYDAVSPYGYPGILLNDEAQADSTFVLQSIEMLVTTFKACKICSAFIRLHPILNAEIQQIIGGTELVKNGTTVFIDLTLSDDAQRRQIKSSRRTRINQCRKRQFFANILPFSQEHIPIFMDIYKDTMDRIGAGQSYYFDRSYYESLTQLSPHIFICIVEFEQNPICVGLITECCGIVQYHLCGTKNEFLPFTPNTLMIDEIRHWATQRGYRTFHLGGGLGGQQDSLFEFKASFSKQICDFYTLRLIADVEVYNNLTEIRSRQFNVDPKMLLSSDFFPAYRMNSI